MSASNSILTIARELAARPEGCSNGEFAKAANLSATAAGSFLGKYVGIGHIFRGAPEGKHSRFFDTQERADAFRDGNETPPVNATVSPVQIAREIVSHLSTSRADEATHGRKVLSNFALAELCKVSPAQIDAALAPLVDAGKMTRISVLRSGTAQFDYRYSAAWVPTRADFALCEGGTAAPEPSISPVAPSPPQPAPPAPAPAATPPGPAPAHFAVGTDFVPADMVARIHGDAAFSRPAALGWGMEEEPEETGSRDHVAAPAGSLDLDVEDLVCAFNSRGELVLDLGGGVQARFKPNKALVLSRFMAGCHEVLEAIAQRGGL